MSDMVLRYLAEQQLPATKRTMSRGTLGGLLVVAVVALLGGAPLAGISRTTGVHAALDGMPGLYPAGRMTLVVS